MWTTAKYNYKNVRWKIDFTASIEYLSERNQKQALFSHSETEQFQCRTSGARNENWSKSAAVQNHAKCGPWKHDFWNYEKNEFDNLSSRKIFNSQYVAPNEALSLKRLLLRIILEPKYQMPRLKYNLLFTCLKLCFKRIFVPKWILSKKLNDKWT